MNPYKDHNGHLTLEGRIYLQEALERRDPVYKIARHMDFSDKALHKEIERNSKDGKYGGLYAHQIATARKESHMAKARDSIRHFNDSIGRINKIEEDIESIKIFMKTISEILEEVHNRQP